MVACFCGLCVSFIYRNTYKGPNYSVAFANSLVSLAMITSIVILLIGNNLARAFGLVGAMSIIRFRTALKDTQDIVLVFFALAVGMAAGIGMLVVALTGTLFVGTVIFILAKSDHGVMRKHEYLLQFSFSPEDEKDAPYLPLFNKYCKNNKLVNVKSVRSGELLEISYYVYFKTTEKSGEFLRKLSKIKGVSQANLFFDEEEF